MTWPVRRATYPSTQSVLTTTANSSIPQILVCSLAVSQQNRGIVAMRANDRMLGTVTTAEDAGIVSVVPLIRRAGRIRTGDLLTPSQTRSPSCATARTWQCSRAGLRLHAAGAAPGSASSRPWPESHPDRYAVQVEGLAQPVLHVPAVARNRRAAAPEEDERGGGSRPAPRSGGAGGSGRGLRALELLEHLVHARGRCTACPAGTQLEEQLRDPRDALAADRGGPDHGGAGQQGRLLGQLLEEPILALHEIPLVRDEEQGPAGLQDAERVF